MVSTPDPGPPPAPPPPPPNPPTVASSSVQDAAARQRQSAVNAAGQGFSGTLLTGAQGAKTKNTVRATIGGAPGAGGVG